MEAVMEAERAPGLRAHGRERPRISATTSNPSIPGTGLLRFIEVKGRVAGRKTVTITKNEILTGLNKPDDFILAMVDHRRRRGRRSRYVRQPFDARAGLRGDQRQLRPGRAAGPVARSRHEQTFPASDYAVLFKEIKDRIAQAQTRAVLSVNAELIRLYWDIGRLIDEQQQEEG